jgi:F-type H+-transporting ATPase subunit c
MLAEAAGNLVGGSISVGLCGLGSAIGVGLVGMKASEAVGRNPGAFGKVIVLAVLGMALAEAIVFYALFIKPVGS